jgi:hypothetical protein
MNYCLTDYESYARAYRDSVFNNSDKNPILLQNLHLSIECYMKQVIQNEVPYQKLIKYFADYDTGTINNRAAKFLERGEIPSHKLKTLARIIALETNYNFPNPYGQRYNKLNTYIEIFDQFYRNEFRYPGREELFVLDDEFRKYKKAFQALETVLENIIEQQNEMYKDTGREDISLD